MLDPSMLVRDREKGRPSLRISSMIQSMKQMHFLYFKVLSCVAFVKRGTSQRGLWYSAQK